MAAERSVNNESTVEHVVNRWLVDYYASLAMEFFQNDKYKDFCAITAVLDSVLVRPLESTDDMSIKIRVLQFLSRINEGEKPDVQFEADNVVSPLESAMILLESMIKEFNLVCQNLEKVCTSLKEMTVGIFIMKNKFAKAKEVLNKYFPKDLGGKRAVFIDLICRETQDHEVIKQMNFNKFKGEMLAFCQEQLCKFRVSFLCKAAMKLVSTRLMEPNDEAATDDQAAAVDECDEPGPSSSPQTITAHLRPCKHSLIQRTRLAMAYKALATCSDKKTFAQLVDDVEAECQIIEDASQKHSADPSRDENVNSEQDGLFQRDSCSPMEASPADQPPQTDATSQTHEGSVSKVPYTVARLVVEPDSQASSQCTTAPEELETEVRTEKLPQAGSSKKLVKDMDCPVTDREVSVPVRKRPRRSSRVPRASTSMLESSNESEDNGNSNRAFDSKNGDALGNQSNRSFSVNRNKSRRSSSESRESTQELLAPCQSPMQRRNKQLSKGSTSNDPGDGDKMHITDSSLDQSPRLSHNCPVPQKSSTPHKDSTHDKGPSHQKFKSLMKDATESKVTWPDEDVYFPSKRSTGSNESTLSNSGHRKRKWTESETQKLKEGVKKFGEGNWSRIQAYYSFKDRTNVNLKDRWRTMKKLNMV